MGHDINEEGKIPAFWPLDNDLPSLPSNYFGVSRTGDLVYLAFGELRPLIGSAAETIEQIRERGGIPIRPLASVVLGLDGPKVLIQLLTNVLETKDLKELGDHIQRTLQERQE